MTHPILITVGRGGVAVQRFLLAALVLFMLAGLPVQVLGQTPPGAETTNQQASAAPLTADGQLDYTAWGALADRAEKAVADNATESAALDKLRGQLVDWREALLGAQNANSSRIATLRAQIAALGPVPAEGETEAEEIATRRAQLNEQLVTLQAPSIAAVEAYSQADGLIREIDRVLRDRQAEELLRLLPSPLNPANWGAAYQAFAAATATVVNEIRVRWSLPAARQNLLNNLPAILFLLLLAIAAISRGWALVQMIIGRLLRRWSARGMRISALAISLGQIVLPFIGMLALSGALQLSGILGIEGTKLAVGLPVAGLAFFLIYWVGGRLFPKSDDVTPLPLAPERRAEGRMLCTLYGLLLAAETLRAILFDSQVVSDAAQAVMDFPMLLVAAFVLWRAGRLLRVPKEIQKTAEDDEGSFRIRVTGFLSRAATIIGIVGPLLAAIGYMPAAKAMVYPAATSLVLIGVLFILQGLLRDIYALITHAEDDGEKALVPVLLGFALMLAALPVFALVWGARVADLTEIWTRLREGFQIGQTRISPTDFMIFAAVFAIGYAVTRMFQGALKTTILPRTKLDQGARNAMISGAGYIGIFLAGLIAINTAGLDLSGLAIVAGALSVGIGFGLQNIVSNFVSGIILLIERPVSEGDWIEVGGVQGIVKSISVRSTRIQTFDRTDVIVPNTDLVAGQVTNWTRFNLSGRLIVPVGVAYGSDTRKVEKILREIAEAQPLAVLTPPPVVVFQGFGADSMDFEIRLILRDVNFSLSVRSEINHEISRRFAAEGIEIPFAQRDINLRNVGDLARAIRGETPPAAAGPAAPAVAPTQAPAALRRDLTPGEGLTPSSAPGQDETDGETR